MAKKATEQDKEELIKFIEFYYDLGLEAQIATTPKIKESLILELKRHDKEEIEIFKQFINKSFWEIHKEFAKRLEGYKKAYNLYGIYCWNKLVEYNCSLFPPLSRPSYEEYLMSILETKRLKEHHYNDNIRQVEREINKGIYPLEGDKEHILELIAKVKDWYMHIPNRLYIRLKFDYKLSEKEAKIRMKEILKIRKKDPTYQLDFSNYSSYGGYE